MPARKVCSARDCPELQPCPQHQRKPWAGSTRRRELPPDWERRRHTVLARNDGICTDGTVCGGLALATEVHHVGDRDDHSLRNLAGVCTDCHRAATQKQAQAARRTLAP